MEDPNRQHPLAPFWVQHGPDSLAYLPWKGRSCSGVDTQWVEPVEVEVHTVKPAVIDRRGIELRSGGIQGLDQLSHVMPIESEQSDERWQLKKQQSGNAVTRRSCVSHGVIWKDKSRQWKQSF